MFSSNHSFLDISFDPNSNVGNSTDKSECNSNQILCDPLDISFNGSIEHLSINQNSSCNVLLAPFESKGF